MEIKEVTLDDFAEKLFQMDKAVFTKPRIHLPARNIEEIYTYFKGNTILAAFDNQMPIGVISYEIDENKKVEIKNMMVLPEFQGKGIGKNLLQFVLDTFPKNILYLVTHPENEQALHVYKKLGFIITGRKENYYGDGEPRVMLEKRYE